ncbi:hypothetical protein HBH56_044610 [Parastagonospora nodorum]|nr:hypothetical protein HBH56_044610 [Parastagonospora nodorum]KAH3933369.1 hypothetical protein HBH54_072360 [Parastagonospora nodorum]KAH3980682.1 hypothetical protein HBH51_050340 [Parastagonospora nodorum]KAH4071935.1 hypothetical protein HBH50_070560 [Parastagonospora nodorum]KAH4094819.1 hypothetical protein HBH48_058820 [Parastagonospora nodorum]
MKFLLLDSSTLACFRTSSLYILSSSGKSWSMNFGILTAADEEVLTKRLTDVVFADALRALIPAFRPISRARSRSMAALQLWSELNLITFEEIIIAPFNRHVRYLDHFEILTPEFAVEILFQPLRLLHVPHGAADLVSSNNCAGFDDY